MRRSGHGPVDDIEDVRTDEVPLAKHANTSSVSLQKLAVLYKLLKLDLGELHNAIDLVFGAVEVLDAKSIHRHGLDSAFVADFEDLGERVSRVSPQLGGKRECVPVPGLQSQGDDPRWSRSCGSAHTAGCRP